MELRSPGCTSSARRCWTGSSASRIRRRDALGTAFGLASGEPPDRFLVGLAVLSLLAEVAEQRPLVCVVDDAHWLDQRLRADARVRRPPAAGRAHRAGVRGARAERRAETCRAAGALVGGLSDERRAALLDTVIAGPVDERVRDRIVAETRGNPLALLELPSGTDAGASSRAGSACPT